MNDVTRDSRREFLKKSAYAAPAILTLAAAPAIAEIGSPNISQPPGSEPNEPPEKCNNGLGNGSDCPPPGMPRNNDQGDEATPGQPQTQGNR